MSIREQLKSVIGNLGRPTPESLRSAVQSLTIQVEQLAEFLETPGDFPYARRHIDSVENDDLEVLVMNWASGIECIPHDHAESFGNVRVITGQVRERTFELDSEMRLSVAGVSLHSAGETVDAPRGLIHSMMNPDSSPLVTLHFYSPPITTMRVFAPERCRGCLVAHCGAWWPTKIEQLVEEFAIGEATM